MDGLTVSPKWSKSDRPIRGPDFLVRDFIWSNFDPILDETILWPGL